MPTGYTASVQEGKVTEFRDFAMECARAFGALVMMRDELNAHSHDMARYIVGQVLNCMVTHNMPPHPVTTTFVERYFAAVAIGKTV